MTLQELVGCQLVVGVPGMEATMEVVDHLRAIHAGGVIPFARNFRSKEQFGFLLAGLKQAVGRELLVMVDHEGGRVVRFHGEGATHFPAAMTMARVHGAAAIERQGATEAAELRGLGVHVNLAPCVDVIVEGCDPIIGDRSYSADPRQVSACGVARIRGLQAHGVAACAKHFPGLGAVQRDPHKTLPTIALDWTVMNAVHLPPFQAAIAAGVATVMSSHVCYPGLGEPPGLPATFSSHLIRDLLRQRMGFGGLVLTDDLEMGALRTFGTIGDAALRATQSGHDILLICSDFAAQQEALSRLRAAYEAGRLPMVELEASVEKMLSLRKKLLS